MASPDVKRPKQVSDGELVEIIEEISCRLRAGEEIDLKEYACPDPERLEQLEQMLPTLKALADLGHSIHDGVAAEPDQVKSQEEPRGALGDYRIIREIGRGGMGVVYEAEQISLGRKVALKVLPFAAMLDQRQLQRFQNEARAAASLKHPSIVQVYAVGCERAVHFYAMEYVEGRTLAEVIRNLRQLEGLEGEEGGGKRKAEGGKLEEQAESELANSLVSGGFAPAKGSSDADAPTAAHARDQTPDAAAETARTPQAAISTERSTKSPAYLRSITQLAIQVAEALDHAHEEGVVHRDVKPSNLILDARGKVWVTDFGLARVEADPGLTMTGDILGTLRYMSPEQALAKRVVVDHRTDVYSLGVTLYELLTLQPAFPGNDRQELMRRIAFEEPVGVRRLNKGIHADLETIVLKAMAKNPSERYDTARELADDLQRFVANEPIRARRVSRAARLRKWCKRNPSLAALTSLAAVLLLSTTIMSVIAAVMNKEAASSSRQLAEQRQSVADNEREARLRIQRAMHELTEAKAAVDLLAEESRQRLVRLYVRSGTDHVERGDYTLALPWFVKALEVDESDPDRAAIHRLRIATTLDRCIKLTAVGFPEHRVDTMQFYPDGGRVLVNGGDQTGVWDVAAGRWTQPQLDGYFARLSPDGKQIALLTHAGKVSLLDSQTGVVVRELRVENQRPEFAGYSEDGALLFVVYGASSIRVWSTGTGEPVTRLLSESGVRVTAARFSPDGKHLVAIFNHRNWPDLAAVWNVQAPAEVQHVPLNVGIENNVGGRWRNKLVVTDSAFVVVVDVMSTAFDLDSGKPKYAPMSHADGAFTGVLSPDRSTLLTCSRDNTARLWDLESGTPIGEPLQHDSVVYVAEFSPDGAQLVTGTISGEVAVWNSSQRRRTFPTLRHAGRIRAAQFSPDGRFLVVASADGSLRTWDLASSLDAPAFVRHFAGWTSPMTKFSNNGQYLAVSVTDASVHVFDTSTHQSTAPPLRHHFYPHGCHVAWNADDSQLLTMSADATLKLWDVHTWKLRIKNTRLRLLPADAPDYPSDLNGNGEPYVSQLVNADFVPGTRRICARTTRRTLGPNRGSKLALFDANTGDMLAGPIEIDSTISDAVVAPSRGEWILAVGDNQKWQQSRIEVRSLEDLKLLRTIPLQLVPSEIQLGGDEEHLVLGLERRVGLPAAEVQLLDLRTGAPVIPPIAHESRIHRVRMLSNGTIVSSTDADGQIRSWDGTTGLAVSPGIRVGRRVSVIAVHPEELWLAAGTGTNNARGALQEFVRLWDLQTGEPISPAFEHANSVTSITISPDGHRMTSSSRDRHARMWTIPQERRSVAELEKLGELVTGLRLDEMDTLVPVDAARFQELWADLSATYPHEFTTTREEENAWLRREIDRARRERDFETALERLDRLIAIDPHDPELYTRRIELLRKLKHWDSVPDDVEVLIRIESRHGRDLGDLAKWLVTRKKSAEADKLNAYALRLADKAIEQAPEDGHTWYARAGIHLQLDRLDKAEEDLTRVVKLLPHHYRPWYELALLQLARSDMAAYQSTCRRMLDSIPVAYMPRIDSFVAWTCCLHSDSVEDFAPIIERARVPVEQVPVSMQYRKMLAAALYRGGHMHEALKHLEEAQRLLNDPSASMQSSPAYTWYFLAMTHHQLGSAKEALRWANKANEWTDQILAEAANPLVWNRRLTLELLRSEAEELLRREAKEPRPAEDQTIPERL